MADDIKIVVDVDDKDVLRTIKNHEILEKRVQELNKEYARLDKAFNKGKISAQTYSKAVQQVDKQIENLQAVMRRGGKEVENLATGMNLSGKAARRNEIAFQQAGYQIQDFIVQVQGGTNPLIAFSQQGSQLAGFFAGPWGAAIGLGIAALSSLAMAFFASAEDAERLQKNLDKIKDGLDDFQGRVKEAEETVSSFAYAMTQVQKTQIEAAWAALGESTAGSFEASFMAKVGAFLGANLWSGFATWGEVSGRLAGDNFAAAFGEGAKGILDQALLDQIGKAIKDKNIEILDSTIQQLSAFSGMTEAGAQFLEYLIRMRDEANGFTEEVKEVARKIEEAASSGEKLSKLDLAKGIGDAAKVAELLALKMGIALEAAYSLINAATQQTSGPVLGGRGLVQPNASDRFMMGLGGEYIPYKPKKSAGGGKSPADQLDEYLTKAKAEAELKLKQVGLSEQAARTLELENKYLEAKVPIDNARIESIVKAEEELRRATDAENRRTSMLQSFSSTIENALMSMVDGSQSVEDAFKSMLRNILLEVYRQAIVKPIANSAASFLTKIFGFADGGAFSSGRVIPFANGGVVSSPTTFPMPGATGLMGEAGPEAIMPLKRGPNGKLGVEMHGGDSPVNVTNVFNLSANGDESVKKIIAQAAPQIAQMTQKQIMDSRRRGGQMKAAFS